jgi:hypothetical protein
VRSRHNYVPFLILTTPCSPQQSGLGVELDWSVPDFLQQSLTIIDFKIYRSTSPGGPYTLRDTVGGATRTYWDTSVNSGTIYYYVVTYEYQLDGTTRESPYSNEILALATSSPTLVAANAWWDVTDVSNPNNPIPRGYRQAPFGFPLNYDTFSTTQPLLIPINSEWHEDYTWSNHITLNLTGYTSAQLAQIKFSFAIDNSIIVYVKNNQYDGKVFPPNDPNYWHDGVAEWSPFEHFPPNVLIAGINEIGVVIGGDFGGNVDYFSMVISKADCSLSGP